MRRVIFFALSLCLLLMIIFLLNECGYNESFEGGDKTKITTLSDSETSHDLLTEEKAMLLLNNCLRNENLKFTIMGCEYYMSDEAFCIKAYYDEGDHITTEGVYLILKESNKIYKQNMLDEGYMEIN